MIEHEREKNVNTPEYWDTAWSRSPEDGENKSIVREFVAAEIADLPERAVWEYGFGAPHFARLIGKARWTGKDHSAVAVKAAKAEGFNASVGRCGDSPGFQKSYLVALEVLEHLDHAEMCEFLEKSRKAPHAFFSVPAFDDAGFAQHMRRWESPEDLRETLLDVWPFVEVSNVGRYFVAHCRRRARPKLTIGCSTLLDFSGVSWTLAALDTIHGDFNGAVEWVVVDNHPEPKDGQSQSEVDDMRSIVESGGARYVRWAGIQGTYPGKNRLKVEARAPWVLTFDSHVMLSPGTVETVLEQIEREPMSDDFYHFPNLRRGSRGPTAVDFRTQDYIYWRKKPTYGWTGEANKGGDPYPIAAMITSCYLVRRAAWLSAKGYDPILGNYGGWEGPLQLKWWLMGRRVLSLRHREPGRPTLHHWHLFNHNARLKNATGRVHTKWSKVRNFAASATVIGGEAWARRLMKRQGIGWDHAQVQAGHRAGMELRPWMIENLARPEWEDITVFFQWMLDQGIPGALTEW